MSRMFGWDLPPGVRLSDIPGNRPEDEAEEAFWLALSEKLEEAGIEAIGPLPPYANANYVKLDDLWDDVNFVKLLETVREMGYTLGFNEGRAEEQMAQMAKDEGEG